MNKKTLLEQYIKSVEDLNKMIDNLRSAGVNFDDKTIDVIYSPVILAAKAIGELINSDGLDWIEWFIWDNDLGVRGLDAGYGKKVRPIRNVDDLWELINS